MKGRVKYLSNPFLVHGRRVFSHAGLALGHRLVMTDFTPRTQLALMYMHVRHPGYI